MRRRLYLSLFVLFLFLLSGCGDGPEPETRIQVSILESQGFTVENNGQYIRPGEDAVFRRQYMAYSLLYSLAATPAGCRISFLTMIDDYNTTITRCDEALSLLLGSRDILMGSH